MELFYKLSDYVRKFNKELADDYDEIYEEKLRDEFDFKIMKKINFHCIMF